MRMWNLRLPETFMLVLATFLGPQIARSTDVSTYLVKKGFEYTQTDSSFPTVNATNGDAFEAEVVMSGVNTVTGASVQPPGGVPLQPLALSTGNKWDYKHKYNSLSKLDQHYPNGNYLFLITGKNDGSRQPALQLLGSVYPNGPYIHNFAATQVVNPNGYLQLGWDAFVGGTTNDFIQFRIEDLSGNKLFETPDLGKQGYWDGTATQALVAPGAMMIGQTNRVTLTFQKAATVDQTSYPGALGEAAYFSRTTFFLATTMAAAPDVKTFEISKARKWVQTDANAIAPETGQEFVFDASVQAYNTGVLASATVKLAPTTNASSRNLVLQSGGTTLDFSDVASTASGLDSFYGTGIYTLVFATAHDGNKSLNLSLPVDSFPPAPRVSNFNALLTVSAGQPFTVAWDPWPAGTINDFIQVRVEDHNFNKFFETPDLGKAGALDGRATSATIPAGKLPAGKGFEIHVTFHRINAVDTTNYPGVLGLSDFQARTKFNIQTKPADVQNYGVFKSQAYQQIDAAAPALLPSKGFALESSVNAQSSNSVVSATLVSPLGASTNLIRQPNGSNFMVSVPFDTKGTLDASYPNGTFSLNVNAADDGVKNLPLALTSDLYPNPPHLSDWPGAQLVDPKTGFNLAWDPFLGGSTNDFIQLVVSDAGSNVVFQTPGLGAAGALNVFAGSVTIPAGTLGTNQVYGAMLGFKKITTVDTNTYPGATGLAGYSTATQFRLLTIGQGNPAVLVITPLPLAQGYQVAAQVLPKISYRIEGSTNLLQWIPLTTNTPGSTALQWTDPIQRGTFFYRSVILP